MVDKVKITRNHQEIKAWAKANKGKPQLIDDLGAESDRIGIRIDFPGQEDEAFVAKDKLVATTWEKFFKIFDNRGLAMVYLASEHIKRPGFLYGAYQFVTRKEYQKAQKDAKELALLKQDFLNNYHLGR